MTHPSVPILDRALFRRSLGTDAYSPDMDRIWQWAWDRYGRRYSWAICAMLFPPTLQIWLFASFLVVAFEKSHHYVEAAAVTVVAVLVFVCVVVRPGLGGVRRVERWAAGHEVDRAEALEATYIRARRFVVRVFGAYPVTGGLIAVVVGAIAGATGPRLVQYGLWGASLGMCLALVLRTAWWKPC
jgi:adenylate cyclase